MSELVTRREFLRRAGLYGGSAWLALNATWPRTLEAAQASSTPVTFDQHEWQTIEAITARIIPTDDAPGAVEAGCTNFIDKALANEDASMKTAYKEGIAALDVLCTKRHGKAFPDLPPAEQDGVLASLQDDGADGWAAPGVTAPAFFEAVRVHTIIGFLSDPKYGGNRDHVGWKLVGYPGPRHMRGGYSARQMLGEEPIDPIWVPRD